MAIITMSAALEVVEKMKNYQLEKLYESLSEVLEAPPKDASKGELCATIIREWCPGNSNLVRPCVVLASKYIK